MQASKLYKILISVIYQLSIQTKTTKCDLKNCYCNFVL